MKTVPVTKRAKIRFYRSLLEPLQSLIPLGRGKEMNLRALVNINHPIFLVSPSLVTNNR